MYDQSNGMNTNDLEWVWRSVLLLQVAKRIARFLWICRASCLCSVYVMQYILSVHACDVRFVQRTYSI